MGRMEKVDGRKGRIVRGMGKMGRMEKVDERRGDNGTS